MHRVAGDDSSRGGPSPDTSQGYHRLLAAATVEASGVENDAVDSEVLLVEEVVREPGGAIHLKTAECLVVQHRGGAIELGGVGGKFALPPLINPGKHQTSCTSVRLHAVFQLLCKLGVTRCPRNAVLVPMYQRYW